MDVNLSFVPRGQVWCLLIAVAAQLGAARCARAIGPDVTVASIRPIAGDPATKDGYGASLYTRYCETCHGVRGEGYAAERANSLRSASFLASVSDDLLRYAIAYGRPGTAMGAYHHSLGGPLTDSDVDSLIRRIREFDTVPPANLTGDATGNASEGSQTYAKFCAGCHGARGRGGLAPTLDAPTFLYTADAAFLRYAIQTGREGTQMPAFSALLTEREANDVVAHILSWKSDWLTPAATPTVSGVQPLQTLVPRGPAPAFPALRAGRYLHVDALKKALDARERLLVLDARVPPEWAREHIPGAASWPYYDVAARIDQLPPDDVWLVVYCSCPTHLSDQVVNILRSKGRRQTAVLDGGLGAWIARGHPVWSEPDVVREERHARGPK